MHCPVRFDFWRWSNLGRIGQLAGKSYFPTKDRKRKIGVEMRGQGALGIEHGGKKDLLLVSQTHGAFQRKIWLEKRLVDNPKQAVRYFSCRLRGAAAL